MTESIFRYLQTIYDYAINYPEDFGNDALVSRIKDGSAFANTSDCCYLYSHQEQQADETTSIRVIPLCLQGRATDELTIRRFPGDGPGLPSLTYVIPYIT